MMLWIVRILGFSLLLLTLVPLLSSGKWYIRWWDFPRMQIAVLLLVPIALAAVQIIFDSSKSEATGWLVAMIVGLAWQVSHIIPFSPLWPKQVPDAYPQDVTTTVMVVNLQVNNDRYSEVADEIASVDPDILLLIEINKEWQAQLAGLKSRYREHQEVIRDQGLGLALWCKSSIQDADVRYLVSERRASIWSVVELASGHRVNFVGVHPTPPGLLDSTGETRRDSRVRDAELILVAREIANRPDERWIVAGDFNDVAWSHTTRLFQRIAGLRDPRVGRNFMGTYHAQYPPCRCPIDHVFLSDGFAIKRLDRQRIPGSDHFAVIADIALSNCQEGVDPQPQGDDRQDAHEIVEEGLQDARQRNLEPATQ